MPPIEWGGHIIEWLFEIGPVVHTGMGHTHIRDVDVCAWQENQEIALTPWECSLIIKLSKTYASGLVLFENPKSPAPWMPIAQPNVKAIDAWTEMLKSHAKKR